MTEGSEKGDTLAGEAGPRAWLTRHPRAVRWILCCPGAFVASAAIMAVLPLWLPHGAAEIDHLVFPILMFPGIWAAVFFYACLERDLIRATSVITALIAVTGLMAVLAATGVLG
ncbi:MULTISPECIES: hypothetical protein [Alphaproteobacteria]|uniref:hypothetical protein n=1 Tax=Alphaproteobacteria TaxID=28211 RepID=UPI00326773A3